MKTKYLFALLPLLSIFILTGCLSNSTERYDITIFTEGSPSPKFQQEINQLIVTEIGENLTLTWNLEQPSHIEEYPTIAVKSHNGIFISSNLNEFEQYINRVDN